MTTTKSIICATQITLAASICAPAMAGEAIATFEKDNEAYKATLELTELELGRIAVSKLDMSAQFDESAAVKGSVSTEMTIGGLMSLAAVADVEFTTGKVNLNLSAGVDSLNTIYGELNFGIHTNNETVRASVALSGGEIFGLKESNLNIDVNYNYDIDTSVGLTFEGKTERGFEIGMEAKMNSSKPSNGSFKLTISRKF